MTGSGGRFPKVVPTMDGPNEPEASSSDVDPRCRRCTQALATIAHDLKAPLAVTRGYIELLSDPRFDRLTSRQESILKEMTGAVERLSRFLDEFLMFYKIQVGIELDLKVLDLNRCISDLVNLWSGQFAKKSVALYWLPGESLISFAFDEPKVQRIVSNLLENALKFTPSGGSVWVQTDTHFWERRAGQNAYHGAERRGTPEVRKANCARIDVSDTGPGIQPEFFHEIFEEFYQLDHGKSNGRGMGLGLAIARRLAELHQGKIWVESEPGSGSKFSVLLPYKQTKQAAK